MIRRCVDQLRAALIGVTLEARLDAAFFQKEILGWLDRHGIEFAVKVSMWKWLGIKQAINSARYWHHGWLQDPRAGRALQEVRLASGAFSVRQDRGAPRRPPTGATRALRLRV